MAFVKCVLVFAVLLTGISAQFGGGYMGDGLGGAGVYGAEMGAYGPRPIGGGFYGGPGPMGMGGGYGTAPVIAAERLAERAQLGALAAERRAEGAQLAALGAERQAEMAQLGARAVEQSALLGRGVLGRK